MATVYLKKVSSWSSSEWSNASVSYVVGQRVRFQTSVQVTTPSYVASPTTFNQWKTYVCLVDHTSTATTPENDATNWIEAGNSREYPYFCLDGSLTSGSSGTQGEVWLSATNYTYTTPGYEGMLWYHTREGLADNEAGKIVLMGDVFSHHSSITQLAFNRLIIESDPAQKEKASIAFVSSLPGIGRDTSGGVVLCRSEFKNINLYFLGTRSSYLFPRGDQSANNGAAFYLENCKFSDKGSEVGLPNPPITSFTFSINYNIYLSAKNTIFDFGYMYLSHNVYYTNSGHHYPAHASGSTTALSSSLENCTFNFVSASDQYFKSLTVMFYNMEGGLVKNCIVYVENTAQTGAIPWMTGTGASSESNFAFVKNFTGGASSGFSAASGLTVANPLFINAAKGDVRLRPASPCIGGSGILTKQAEMEAKYPTGVWYDSGAAAGGTGTWAAPFNDVGPAIESFTGDEAVILIKEGTHAFPKGTYNSSAGSPQSTANDLIRAYSLGIKLIGMGPKSILATTNLFEWPAWYSWASGGLSQATFPNISSTTFYFKDLHVSQDVSCGRGAFDTPNFDLENVTARPTTACLAITAPVFGIHGGDHPGNTMKMRGCTFIGTPYKTSQPYSAIYFGGGTYDFKDCSFIDDNQFNNTSPDPYISSQFMYMVPKINSVMENCVFYASTPGYTNQGFVPTGPSFLTLKNCCLFYTEADWTTSFAASLTAKVNCMVTDPHLLRVKFPVTDPRLRPNSPLIGGLPQYPSGTNIWYVNFASGNDSNDGKSPITAMATLSAAHTASANDDTIYIVDEQVTLSADLTFEGGRIYRSLTHCSFDGGNSYHVEMNNTAGVKTELIKFKFLNLNHANYLVQIIGSDSSTITQIKSCEIRGTLTARGRAIGYANGAIGTCIKDTAIFCTFLHLSIVGGESQGFHELTNCEMSGCTLVVAPNSNASSTHIYIGGVGGCGSHSHTPPYGRQIVKNCVVYGNNRMRYGAASYSLNDGGGAALGFLSNCGTTPTNANFIVYNTALYGILNADNGKWPEYNGVTNNYWGGAKADLGISDSLAAQLFYDDPALINPNQGEMRLRPDSNLIGKGI